MKIQEVVSRNRRDFTAIYECEHCEHCGHTVRGHGYDDENFHMNVIPAMECEQCGKTPPADYTPLPTKYPDGVQV